MKNLLTRDVDFTPVERAEGEEADDGRTLRGYGAVFNQATSINSPFEGVFRESVAPGAFARTLSQGTPIMQFNHGHDPHVGTVPIAEIKELREDAQGLYVEARMFDNDLVKPVRQAIAGKAIKGMSFNFHVKADEWRDGEGKLLSESELERLLWDAGDRGPLQRKLLEVELHEVGPVVRPAYPGTSVGVRSAGDITAVQREEVLRSYASTMRAGGPQTPKGPSGPATPSPLPGDKLTAESLAAAGYTSEQVEEFVRSLNVVDNDDSVIPEDDPTADGYTDDDPSNHPFVDGNCATCGY